jgi:hypothetical protein
MSKRPRVVDFEKRWSQGRGQGSGAAYQPWLIVQSFPSKGEANRHRGWKTHRVQHFLSILERKFFYVLEWSTRVTDIREQFPLWPVASTLEVANHIGVKHPTDPNTKQEEIMTTDFVITVQDGDQSREIARTVKYAIDLEKIRTIEKLEIERLWWEARGVDWGIVTEHEIPEVLAKNVENLHAFLSLEGYPQLQNDTHELIRYLTRAVEQTAQPLSQVTSRCDEEFTLADGSFLALSRHLIATRQWVIDMDVEFNSLECFMRPSPRDSGRSPPTPSIYRNSSSWVTSE